MRTTDERMAALKQRSKEIETQKRMRRGRIVSIASIAACLVLIVGTAFALPGVMENPSHTGVAYTGPAASLFASGAALGYILIGILAFALGVCVTILCYRLHLRNKADEDDDD